VERGAQQHASIDRVVGAISLLVVARARASLLLHLLLPILFPAGRSAFILLFIGELKGMIKDEHLKSLLKYYQMFIQQMMKVRFILRLVAFSALCFVSF